jgi:uncharacterized protein
MESTFDYKKFTWIAGMLALGGIFFATVALGASEWKSLNHPNGQTASITVSGEGEVTTLPDIATVNITIRESAKTVPEAQKLAEAKVKAAIAALSGLGVHDLDQKTLSYNVSPKYENVPVSSGTMYPSYNQKIVGYEVTQSVEIKVRDIEAAGEIIGALGAANITEIYGPSFAVDNMDEAKAEAKEKAIAQAREKAKATAKALGATLGDVMQFSEDAGGYYPMLYKASDVGMGMGGSGAPEVSLPQGENVIKSRVTITYSLN